MNALAIIHIAKKELRLDDDTFRDVLDQVTGKRSTKEMSHTERLAVIAHFKAKGFVVKRGGKSATAKTGLSSKGYVRLIFALWKSCADLGVIEDGSKKALRSFVVNQTSQRGDQVDDPDFLTYDQASPIIETLKSMEARGKRKSQ